MKPEQIITDIAANDPSTSLAYGALAHEQYWAIDVDAGRQLLQMLQSENLSAHVARFAAEQAQRATVNVFVDGQPHAGGVKAAQSQGKGHPAPVYKSFRFQPLNGEDGPGIAQFSLMGPMMKRPSSFSSATSTVYLKQQIRAARKDPDVLGAAMVADSPGGTVAGTAELADEIAAFSAEKPFYTFGEDMIASACLWAASQSTKVFANRTALIGSFGTVMVLYDLSRFAANKGIEVLVFSTGDMKGAGTEGAVITPDQRAYFQGIVNDLQADFHQAVQSGRRMSDEQMAAISDARIYKAPQAMAMGLVDAVGSLDEMMAELLAHVATTVPANRKKKPLMQSLKPGQPGTTGSSAHAGTTIRTQEKPLMRNFFAAALSRLGLTAMALAVMGAPAAQADSDDPETAAKAIAESMATQVKAEIETASAQAVEQALAADPLLAACKAAGIDSPSGLSAMQERAKLGEEYERKARAEVGKLAVVALGATEGAEAQATLADMDFKTVQALGRQYEAIAKSKGLMTETGAPAPRQTAAGGASATADGVQASDVQQKPAGTLRSSEAIYADRAKTMANGK